MQSLHRKEQEQVVLTFERDYGQLLMKKNHGLPGNLIGHCAKELLGQINQVNTISYFEDDLMELLTGIAQSIKRMTVH